MERKSRLINVLYIVSVVSLIVLGGIIMFNDFLPSNLRNTIFLVTIALYILIGLVLIKFRNRSKISGALISIVLLFLLGTQSLASYYIQNTYSKYNENLELSGESVTYTLITLRSNPVNTVDEMKKAEVIYNKEDKEQDIKKMSERLLKYNEDLEFKQADTVSKNYRDLLNGKLSYMILNNSLIDVLENDRKEFEKKVKVVQFESDKQDSSLVVDNEHKDIIKETHPEDSFVLYISGADNYEDSNEPTRSDVNIVLAVNPQTNKILMTSIPRDSYVYMTGLGYDKLTHTGIYGIGKSITTIEDLLDIDINYYAKVNFTSLIDLVDVLGGVTIYNDYSFTSKVGGYYFERGEVTLNGSKALGFVRERYSLPNGDEDRARNQMKVLEAIIRKLISPSILVNYNSILETTLKSVKTNVPSSIMTGLINNQLSSSAGWEITNNEIKGEGRMDLPSYAMPYEQLFMSELYDSSVTEASSKIKNILKER